MAYAETLARRIRKMLASRKPKEIKMFGGLAFMLNGHMCCGVLRQDLILRLGDTQTLAALRQSYTRPFDFTGRVMKSMLVVSPKGYQSDADLSRWIKRAVDYVMTLGPKHR